MRASAGLPVTWEASTETCGAAGSSVSSTPCEGEVDLAGGAVPAAVELTAEDDPCSHAGSDREEDEVVDAAGDALPLLAQGGQVDVVLERHREAERALELATELAPLEPLDVLGEA